MLRRNYPLEDHWAIIIVLNFRSVFLLVGSSTPTINVSLILIVVFVTRGAAGAVSAPPFVSLFFSYFFCDDCQCFARLAAWLWQYLSPLPGD